MNQTTLLGRLGQDPELRTTSSGVEVCDFSVATSRKYKDASGNQMEDTQWHRCVAWRGRAKAIAQYFSKGDQILIQGENRTEPYEKDGVKHYPTKVHVNNFHFAAKGNSSHATEPPPATSYTGADMSSALGGSSNLQSQVDTSDEPLAF